MTGIVSLYFLTKMLFSVLGFVAIIVATWKIARCGTKRDKRKKEKRKTSLG